MAGSGTKSAEATCPALLRFPAQAARCEIRDSGLGVSPATCQGTRAASAVTQQQQQQQQASLAAPVTQAEAALGGRSGAERSVQEGCPREERDCQQPCFPTWVSRMTLQNSMGHLLETKPKRRKPIRPQRASLCLCGLEGRILPFPSPRSATWLRVLGSPRALFCSTISTGTSCQSARRSLAKGWAGSLDWLLEHCRWQEAPGAQAQRTVLLLAGQILQEASPGVVHVGKARPLPSQTDCPPAAWGGRAPLICHKAALEAPAWPLLFIRCSSPWSHCGVLWGF